MKGNVQIGCDEQFPGHYDRQPEGGLRQLLPFSWRGCACRLQSVSQSHAADAANLAACAAHYDTVSALQLLAGHCPGGKLRVSWSPNEFRLGSYMHCNSDHLTASCGVGRPGIAPN